MLLLRFFICCLVLFVYSTPCFSQTSWVYEDGVCVDMRQQYSCDGAIPPPHPENIPRYGQIQETIIPFNQYYAVNYKGERREDEGKTPVIPEYSVHYGTRSYHPYTKQQYIDVWRRGKKVGNIDDLTDEYAISFFSVEHWCVGPSVASWRARKVKQKPACFFYVEDSGTQGEYMKNAKRWAKMWGMKVFFGTIDQGIPLNWIYE